jgi:hypothetical protein
MKNYEVGDKATYVIYTDRMAGYIIAISKSGDQVTFQEGNATLLNVDEVKANCFHAEQKWGIEPDPNGKIMKFSRRQFTHSECWKLVNHPTKSPGCSLHSGHSHYYDYGY